MTLAERVKCELQPKTVGTYAVYVVPQTLLAEVWARVGELEAELAKERAAPIEVSEQLSRMVLVTDEECARLERVNRELEARLAVPRSEDVESMRKLLVRAGICMDAADMLERLARRVQQLEKELSLYKPDSLIDPKVSEGWGGPGPIADGG